MTKTEETRRNRSQGRLVLEGVQKVGFYDGSDRTPQDIPFPSCMAAALRFMGEDYPLTTFVEKGKTWRHDGAYTEMLAASGMAFGLRWKEGWYQDNADMMFAADPEKIIKRAFAHAGYTFYGVDKKTHEPEGGHESGQSSSSDEERFICEIRGSLEQGKPVLGFGVVGPPECSLIAGYDEGGNVLIGWSFFQDLPPFNRGVEREPNGMYRKRDWFPGIWSLLVIGDKIGRADPAAQNLEILRWGITVARAPGTPGRRTGLAAYDAWSKQVLTNADFLTDDERVLQSRHEVHNSAVSIVAECRWEASELLKSMAESETDMASDLLAASHLYRKEHDLMWQAWGMVGGNGNPQAFREFAKASVRKDLASVILQARDLDTTAIGLLERAVQVQSGHRAGRT